MTYDRHITFDRMRWALDLAFDPLSRRNDPPWYNSKEVQLVLREIARGQPVTLGFLRPEENPFTIDSVLRIHFESQRRKVELKDLELWKKKSPERNRLFVYATIPIFEHDKYYHPRLDICKFCHRVFLRTNLPKAESVPEKSSCSKPCKDRLRRPAGARRESTLFRHNTFQNDT